MMMAAQKSLIRSAFRIYRLTMTQKDYDTIGVGTSLWLLCECRFSLSACWTPRKRVKCAHSTRIYTTFDSARAPLLYGRWFERILSGNVWWWVGGLLVMSAGWRRVGRCARVMPRLSPVRRLARQRIFRPGIFAVTWIYIFSRLSCRGCARKTENTERISSPIRLYARHTFSPASIDLSCRQMRIFTNTATRSFIVVVDEDRVARLTSKGWFSSAWTRIVTLLYSSRSVYSYI